MAQALRADPRSELDGVSVSIRDLSLSYGAVEVLGDLNLDVNDGEFLVLLGPSGAGKTTTLRLITGLESPDAGSVMIDGRDVTLVGIVKGSGMIAPDMATMLGFIFTDAAVGPDFLQRALSETFAAG